MKTAESESRIFFKPGQGDVAQILGVDFAMLDYGKSRLSITTDRKVPYHVERKGPKALVLDVEGATIPPLLLRHLDSKYFEGALDRVRWGHLSVKKQGLVYAPLEGNGPLSCGPIRQGPVRGIRANDGDAP